MTNPPLKNPAIVGLASMRRKRISLSPNELVRAEPLVPGQRLPLAVMPAVDGVDLPAWAENNRELIKNRLTTHGALLFRNFHLRTVEEFEQFVARSCGELLQYTYRSTPRSHVSGNIYTSTEYPAEQFIPFHNEMAYARTWPLKICFFCVKSAEQGGDTPIADSRRVFTAISDSTRERFITKGVAYVRNYGNELDLPWQEVFQTTDKTAVESYCRNAGIELEWLGEHRLRTREVCQAIAKHPETSERVWFNQAHLFHVSSLPSNLRELMLAEFKEEDLPRNAYYGDGSPIEIEALEEIRNAYQQEAVNFSWQDGDVLMLDNMLTAHARAPFEGQRKIVVGMAEAASSPAI